MFPFQVFLSDRQRAKIDTALHYYGLKHGEFKQFSPWVRDIILARAGQIILSHIKHQGKQAFEDLPEDEQ